MNYCGIDYHKKFSHVSVMDESGEKILERRIPNKRAAVEWLFSELSGDSVAVVEATRNWIRIHDLLEEFCEVKLAHPLKLKAIAWAKVKTDSIDSRTLADLLRADLIPEAHVPTPEVREMREVLRQRAFFVRLRTALKNRIHVLIDRHAEYDEMASSFSDLFGKTGLAWLGSLELVEGERRRLDEDLHLLELLNKLVKADDRWIEELSKQHPEIALLRTVPGFGPLIAALLWAEIDGIERFPHPKKLHAYAGLVPSTYQSSDRTRYGKLTKCGNKWIRWAAIEAVRGAINSDMELHELYLKHKQKSGGNRAKVVVARRLLAIAFRVLKEKRSFRARGVAPRSASANPAARACA